jgi:hypothetical protein
MFKTDAACTLSEGIIWPEVEIAYGLVLLFETHLVLELSAAFDRLGLLKLLW